jgi:hypothetical protein
MFPQLLSHPFGKVSRQPGQRVSVGAKVASKLSRRRG